MEPRGGRFARNRRKMLDLQEIEEKQKSGVDVGQRWVKKVKLILWMLGIKKLKEILWMLATEMGSEGCPICTDFSLTFLAQVFHLAKIIRFQPRRRSDAVASLLNRDIPHI